MNKILPCAFLICLIISGSIQMAFAQKDTSSAEEKNLKIIPLPVIYYAPETRLGLGALLNFAFKTEDSGQTRTSNARTYFIYTLNKQIDITGDFTLFTPQEKYVMKGRLSYLFFPEYYYGIGNDLPDSTKEQIEYKRIRLEYRALRKISKNLFAGLQYRYAQMYNLVTEPEGMLQTFQETGYQGYLISGLGAALLWDSRDNILNPYKGSYIEIANINYLGFLGSEQEYSNISVDLRKYFKVSTTKNIILAAQLYGNFIIGDAPFKELSELGSQSLMRGYYRGRYRAKGYYAFQSEIRVPVFWRIGVVGFAGLGDVTNHNNEFEWDKVKPNYGLGARIQIDPRDRVNIRLDYGFGSKGISNFYIDVTEAF